MNQKLIDDEVWHRIVSLHTSDTGNPGMNYHNVRFLALSVCGEAGELANIIKKQWRGLSADGGVGELWREARDEVADIIILSLLLYSALGDDPQHEKGLRATIMRKLDKFEAKLRASGKTAAFA